MNFQDARLQMAVEMPGSAVVTGGPSGKVSRDTKILRLRVIKSPN